MIRKILGQCLCIIFLIAVSTPTDLVAKTDQGCSDSDQLSPSISESIYNNKDVWKVEECNSVRHIQSNTLCEASIGSGWPLDRLIIFPSDPTITRGYDVACDYRISEDGFLTLYITHYDRSPDEETAFLQINSAILSRFPDAQSIALLSTENDKYAPLSALYLIYIDQKKYHTGVWYRKIEGWEVKIRATYPAEPQVEAMQNQILTLAHWLSKAQAFGGEPSE